ncbi:glycosyltransferase family 2 protein, partial [candidate division CSSED10-310 bacterium]
MTAAYQLTGSIVLYKNDSVIVRNAIESFLNTCLQKKLFLIDNSPTDVFSSLAAEYPELEYRLMDRNVGFGAGHNQALQVCLEKTPYHLVLNPDISFEVGQLEKLYAYMEQYQDVGLVMPKIILPDGQMQYLCKLLPTPFDLFIRRFLPDLRFLQRSKEAFELRFADYDTAMPIPYLSGCFMFLRTAVLQRIGLFDERFFLYLEDTDLTRRIYETARTMYYPEVHVIHRYGQDSYKKASVLIRHIISAIKYFSKWGWFIDP